MPSAIGRFVPIRFLALTGHFVILVTLLWSMDANLQSCLPIQYTQTEFDDQKMNLTIGLSVGIALFGFELLSFLMGVSMFVTSIALISTLVHVIASILLSMYILDSWYCESYWYIFGFCSATPAFFELMCVLLYSLGKRK